MMEFILWVIFTKNSVKSCNNKKNCDYFIDGCYWWLLIIVDDYLVIIIIMVVIKKDPNKLILVVVYIGLLGQFETFFFTIRFHKYKKALKSTKKHQRHQKALKSTTNVRFIDLKFIDIRFIDLKFSQFWTFYFFFTIRFHNYKKA